MAKIDEGLSHNGEYRYFRDTETGELTMERVEPEDPDENATPRELADRIRGGERAADTDTVRNLAARIKRGPYPPKRPGLPPRRP